MTEISHIILISMDPFLLTTLVASVSRILTPLLPHLTTALVTASKSGVEKIGEEIGGDVWEQAQNLWGLLKPKLNESEESTRKIEEISNAVSTTLKQDAPVAKAQMVRYTSELAMPLEQLLANDPELTRQVAAQLQNVEQAATQVAVFNIGRQIAEKIINVGRDVGHISM